MSKVVSRARCPKCASNGKDTSGDNLAVYEDGGKYCFACQYSERGGKVVETNKPETPTTKNGLRFLNGNAQAIPHRRINEDTARKYGYETLVSQDKNIEIASFYKDGVKIAQKLRGPNKSFQWRGQTSGVPLWGQELFKARGGKMLVITEGEIDCMTVSQLMNNKWPVVSLPSGAAGAARAIKDNLEFISSYKEVILMFDQDEAGQDAVKSVADILPPGKCKVAKLPYKDPNECIMKGAGKAVISALWEAQHYSPDEIVHVSDIVNDPHLEETRVYPFPFDNLSEFLLGQRSGEITLWASGTGSGKSTILRELMHHHLMEGRSVGAIMLEESPQETVDDMVSLILNKPVRAIRAKKLMNELRIKLGKDPINIDIIDDLTDEEYAEARRELEKNSLYVYDHLGNAALENLCARMEFMAVSLGVDVIVLDHITAAAAGLLNANSDYDNSNSERLLIDNIMKELRSLVSRTGVRIDVVSQLKKTTKSYEEGDRITLQDLRGSGSLASVPNVVVALERDRQNPDPIVANTTTVRVLKNRLTGKAGVASCLLYDHGTGRLKELEFAVTDEGSVVTEPA
jgi:twinkle protein